MLIVVVDSATPAITAALASVSDAGIEMLAEAVTVDGRAHGELLAPAIASVLAEGGAGPRDLDAVVAGLGPGPFTGLRVGLVTAAALADTLNIPAYGVCTLDALGWAAGPGRILVATDARRKEIYWAVYEDGVRLTEPAVGKPADLLPPNGVGPLSDDASRSAKGAGSFRDGAGSFGDGAGSPSGGAGSFGGGAGVVPGDAGVVPGGAGVVPGGAGLLPGGVRAAVGDGALRYADVLGLPVLDEPRYPPASGFAALAADRVRTGMPTEPLTPLYLRRPDAVLPGARKPALR
ncbi:MAG TPA: tRNA (adenosine(37)-N6)-threonylcarbamoyltransferase complex dimerization subunit type 1 TsaB [Rugosimonospora sp.]